MNVSASGKLAVQSCYLSTGSASGTSDMGYSTASLPKTWTVSASDLSSDFYLVIVFTYTGSSYGPSVSVNGSSMSMGNKVGSAWRYYVKVNTSVNNYVIMVADP